LRAFAFGLSGFFDGVVGVVGTVAGGWVSVGVVGGGAGSGVTASHAYRWPSKTITVPSPRPSARAQIHWCPFASVQT
jgi:hypothetical protein